MQIKKNYNLKNLTTLHVGGPARFFTDVRSVKDVKQALKFARQRKLDIFTLSGGSNVVISDRGFEGLVIHMNILGFEVIKQDAQNVWLKVGAGETWDEVVEQAVKKGWQGAENMSLIPGKIGGCIIQNSGAYGSEIKDVVEEVKVIEVRTGKIKKFKNEECGFGYRQSIFNGSQIGKYIVVEVTLKLISSKASHLFQKKLAYPDVKKYFVERNVDNPSLKQIRQAIIYIRNNKLPDMSRVGTVGSFFKNLYLSKGELKILKDNISHNFGGGQMDKLREFENRFKVGDKVKIPTAWLIDICGLKGIKVGCAMVYERQPLILVTQPGMASATQVMELSKMVRTEVYQKTGMKIEPEPDFIGFSQDELADYFELG